MRLTYGMAVTADAVTYGMMAAVTAAAVMAAQPAAAAIDLGEVYGSFKPYIEAAVTAGVVGLVGVVLELLRRKLNLSIDDSSRAALQTALTNGAGLALNKIGNSLQGRTVEVGHPAVEEALRYVLAAAPAAIARFGLSPDQLREKIIAKMPQVANTTTAA